MSRALGLLVALSLVAVVLVLPAPAMAQSAPAPSAWWAAWSPVDNTLSCNIFRAYYGYAHAMVYALLPRQADQLAAWSEEPFQTWARERAASLAAALPTWKYAEFNSHPEISSVADGQSVMLVDEAEVLIDGQTHLAERMRLAYRLVQAADDDTSWHVVDAQLFERARYRLDPNSVQAVSDAFSAYLARLNDVATGTGDLDSLDAVSAGPDRDSLRAYFSGLRESGTFQQMQPELTVNVVDVRGDEADVTVHGQIHYALFDPQTGQPSPDQTKDETWERSFHLQRFDGATWKVTHSETPNLTGGSDIAAGCAAAE